MEIGCVWRIRLAFAMLVWLHSDRDSRYSRDPIEIHSEMQNAVGGKLGVWEGFSERIEDVITLEER